MLDLEERVDDLHQVVRDFVLNVGIEFNKLYNSQMRTEAELRAFKDEMREFKDEMKDFKEEMREFKDEMLAFKDEMKDFKEEMREFKDEMLAFKDEMQGFKNESRQNNREMNRRWGELANKMGTMVEDLVAPSLARIIRRTLGREVVDLSVRRKRKVDGKTWESDAIAITDDRRIGLNSTKSTLRSADIDRFIHHELVTFRHYFPEYADYPVMGIVATLAVGEDVLRYAEGHGLLVLAVGDSLMEVKNSPDFKPKWWT